MAFNPESSLAAMDLSIIVVNWNSTDYLRESVRSIFEHTADLHFEIIIVDNASPVDDVDILKDEFSGITLIKSRENLGFARANNLGFRSATGRYILFLNPDTRLVNSAINLMVDQLKILPESGVVGCKLLNGDLSIQTSCIQTFPTILNQVLDADYLRNRWPRSSLWGVGPLFFEVPAPVKVEGVSGACMMIRREVFEKAGLFSDVYFMYAEDLDLCRKVVRAGHSNYYVGAGVVVHYGGKSSTPLWATAMKWRSILLYCTKNHGRCYALLFRFAMILAAVARLTMLALAWLFACVRTRKRRSDPAAAKWRTILKTMLTQPAEE